jgi:UrcA family protein
MKTVTKTRSKLAKSMVAASFFAIGSAAAMAQQQAAAAETSTTTVSLAGLDLSTPEGVTAARERLRHTASRLCAQVADELDLSHHANFLKCVDDAMARSLPRLEELARRNVPPSGLASNLSK